ncbi:MAG: DUF3185 domain-containing protein [Candidatus Rokuibacteriota bacterium]
MKPLVLIGIALIVLGLAALAYQGILATSREKKIADAPKTIPLSPVLGALALAGGLLLVIAGNTDRAFPYR